MINILNDHISLCEVLYNVGRNNNTGITFIQSEGQEIFMSYRELWIEASYILYELQSRGIKAGNEVVFQIDDNESFVKVFWACLLGGIIPVPVTAGNNDEHRTKLFNIWKCLNNPYLITDAKILSVLDKFNGNKGLTGLIEEVKAKTLLLEEIKQRSCEGEIYNAKLGDIAFIQFSSGSTGDPKGVILTHENLLTNVDAIISSAGLTSKDSTLSWMPLTHDMGMIGGHLVPVALGIMQYSMPTSLFIRYPTLWMRKANQHKTTVLSSPNFGYKYFLTFFSPDIAIDWDLSHVRLIFNGAEPISSQLCNAFLEQMKEYGMKNNVMYPVYGLAEASLAVSFPKAGEDMSIVVVDRNSINIGETVKEIGQVVAGEGISFVDLGYPVKNCSFRICSSDNSPLGENQVGYIQIKGRNVTCGYYNNKKATASTFTEDGWLITGDLGFVRNGRLLVTGRAKDIIFVNGQNYYPHDIERVANSIEGLKLTETVACSVYNEENQKEDILLFVLYKKSVKSFIPVAMEMMKHINQRMALEIKEVIPVKKIPKTTSGKVQRYKLAERFSHGEFTDLLDDMHRYMDEEEMGKEFSEPVNDTEARLLNLCCQVLGKKKIGTQEGFFELGGDSLKAATLAAEVHKEFGCNIPLSEVFKAPTIKELAQWLDSAEKKAYAAIEKVGEKEYYQASAAQKRLYILSQMEEVGTSYNLPQVLEIGGKLDTVRFEEAFGKLARRHETLRTSFEMVDGEPVQKIHKDVELKVVHIEAGEQDIEAVAEGFIRPFDLGSAPLIRIGLVKLAEDRHIMLFDMHHIISDGTSIGILVKEFVSLYGGDELPELTVQYKDFSAWQERILKGEENRKQEEYWLEQFEGEIPV
ncbi:MAG: AMP-binding protein, partial [Clostridia bacterium]|nr:AMP-binding protein [Clostridia bacterium]